MADRNSESAPRRVTATQPFHHRAVASLAGGYRPGMVELCAEMSAVVITVLVHAGDAVDRDQPLVVLESMKMEIPVLAEAAGIVRRVCVVPGESVHEGSTLIELD